MSQFKKLIEVALPLEDINAASAREKSIRHGHPSTLHLWWARRPLAAARAVIFAQMVDDPSAYVDELWEEAALLKALAKQVGRKAMTVRDRSEVLDDIMIKIEREHLFDLIRQLVLWENTTNERVLNAARAEIRKSWQRTCRREGKPEDTPLPGFHDPFAGGGAIPLEAQRLGFEAHASDLNPVAVLINKAMIEFPPKFANLPPVNPEAREEKGSESWRGATGLAEDVRRYGAWMREEAHKRIGHLYPPVEVTEEMVQQRPDLKAYQGQKLTVIAWIWARTVKSPNPAVSHVDVPLASTFILSSKSGKEAYVRPVIEGDRYHFEVKVGKPPAEAKAGTKLSRGANFRCLITDSAIKGDYIKSEGRAGRMGAKLMAVVMEGHRGRVYLSPTAAIEKIAQLAEPTWRPETDLPIDPRNFWTVDYGLTTYGDLFTPRQLVALTTFSDLVGEAREHIGRDALAAGMPNDGKGLEAGGTGAKAYAEAVSVYLAFLLNQVANHSSTICGWNHPNTQIRSVFARQALPMTWDYAEANIFSESSGSYHNLIERMVKGFVALGNLTKGTASQADAQNQNISAERVISTDPPYYDNIGYADLSDFFYVWLRKSLSKALPSLFSTISVPKAEELVATPYRHGTKHKAENFFLDGMTLAIQRFASLAHPVAPLTIYYAFKQSETTEEDGTISPGWVSFLGAVQQAGLEVSGTWPVRTEKIGRVIGIGTNALASSIVLVCRKRSPDAPMATRREFVQALQRELPKALIDLQHGNIAPVDLPQSSIGPGMAIFSRYAKVVESDGKPMSVRTALQLINQSVDEFLSEQEAQMDDWTRFAITWFNQFGFQQGAYGDAQNIATARNVTVEGVRDAGILETGGGKVRLLRIDELEADWSPTADARCTVWEVVHHLIKRLNDGGEEAAAKLLKEVGGLGEDARTLCYRLYTLCEQKKWADEARAYNTLIGVWPGLTKLSDNLAITGKQTQSEFGI